MAPGKAESPVPAMLRDDGSESLVLYTDDEPLELDPDAPEYPL